MILVLSPLGKEVRHGISARAVPAMSPSLSPTTKVKPEEGGARRRHRAQCESKGPGGSDGDNDDDDGNADGAGDGDGHHDGSSNSDGPSRKRLRSRKGLVKKHPCLEPNCGKSYSRAEHLSRHQLNHNPQKVYKCDFGGCTRQFVRLDLCNRHRDRHISNSSSLNRKDSMLSQTSSFPAAPLAGSAAPESTIYRGNPIGLQCQYKSVCNTPAAFANEAGYRQLDQGFDFGGPQPSPNAAPRPGIYAILPPAPTHDGFRNGPQSMSQPHSAAQIPHVPRQRFGFFSLPAATYGGSATNLPPDPRQPLAAFNEQCQLPGNIMLDQMAAPTTMPVFGGTDILFSKSPYVGMPADYMAYLINTQQGSDAPMVGVALTPGYNYSDFSHAPHHCGPDLGRLGYFPAGQVMSVTNLVEQNLPESVISDDKRAEIYDIIRERFRDRRRGHIEKQRNMILEGDPHDDSHMLSRKMMQGYIMSYWVHVSEQFPILHKPTFSPDKTPGLLLIAMMTLGAACLDRRYGAKMARAGAHLSNFLAWHLRSDLSHEPDGDPPAKLWVMQTYLLLEVYEKTYSTRALHERAVIYHASTITLMRRGAALLGRPAMESPHSLRGGKDGKATPSKNSDQLWADWVTNEATRRAACACFVMDSIHATMFGHSIATAPHEICIPLPCDDALWKAKSAGEVSRIESQAFAQGRIPIMCSEGFRRMLAGEEVDTTPFGRMVLMAGLLSICWHLNQRDVQINSLGSHVKVALGGRENWRTAVCKAYDWWRDDFDKALARNKDDLAVDPYRSYERSRRSDVVFESRTVMHNLAHMAMHVDIIECQIYARAKQLLNKAVGAQDLHSTESKMRDFWAPSAKARDAYFYAMKLLGSVMMPESAPPCCNPDEPYSARDDVLLYRPWVLYFAGLVVWCYGYALEGPCPDYIPPSSPREKAQHMRDYLVRLVRVQTPDELPQFQGYNRNSALLMVIKESFETARWELLHEGAALLGNCIRLNAGVSPG